MNHRQQGLKDLAGAGGDPNPSAYVTEDLIRKRAEHNECVISTLQELSLHQQDIERIEYLDKWCRELKILYLQSNLIPKIENVGRLKKLEYINLALNNIERIENLEGCESLKKLDLTVNFVGELTSIESLKHLIHLRELFLTGNPCTEYIGYRPYVISTLPQLKYLDGVEIEKSERIVALQSLPEFRDDILKQQRQYAIKREKQKLAEQREGGSGERKDDRWYTDIDTERDQSLQIQEIKEEKTEEEKEKEFWDEKVPFTPESRIKVHEHMKEVKRKEEAKSAGRTGPDPPKRERRLQGPDGRMFNINEAKVDFELTENDNEVQLDVTIFKHMDTSLCDVDVQPTYVRVVIKDKVLQLVLPEEVKPDSSSAKRSQATGHLLITMPKVNQVVRPARVPGPKEVTQPSGKKSEQSNGYERLEADPSVASTVDYGNIVTDTALAPKLPLLGARPRERQQPVERQNSEGFEDDPDVPPLM